MGIAPEASEEAPGYCRSRSNQMIALGILLDGRIPNWLELDCYVDPTHPTAIPVSKEFPVSKRDLEVMGPHQKDIVAASKIHAINQVREAVGTMGCALETACFDTVGVARQSRKIRVPRSRVDKIDFDAVVHFLRQLSHQGRKYRQVLTIRQRDSLLRSSAEHSSLNGNANRVREGDIYTLRPRVRRLSLIFQRAPLSSWIEALLQTF